MTNLIQGRRPKFVDTASITQPRGNMRLYDNGDPGHENNNEFFTRYCMWATQNGLDTPEFLVPQIEIHEPIEPFLFERRFAASGQKPPTQEEIDRFAAWDYQIEWGSTSTLGMRRENEWLFHRYRASLFPSLAEYLLGDDRASQSVLDVACHCGIMALEFAERGFGRVAGLELREHNVRQANFLKETFSVPNTEFFVENARNLGRHKADVVFCGGVLYHVTFPVELATDLFHATGKFLIFDSLCQNHPFSGFHILGDRNVQRTLDGDNAIELIPTYRAMIDLMRNAGFDTIYEILGREALNVPMYNTRNVRSFLAVKPGVELPRLTDLVR
jgi:Methyltransferase domain